MTGAYLTSQVNRHPVDRPSRRRTGRQISQGLRRHPERPTPPATPSKRFLPGVHLRLDGVPADQVRDVLRYAINPLATAGASVTVSIEISAVAPNGGLPSDLVQLTVIEGLRQIGLDPKLGTGDA